MDRHAGQNGEPQPRCVPAPGKSGGGGWRPVIDYAGHTYSGGCPHRGHRHPGHIQAARCASGAVRRFKIALRRGSIDADGVVYRDGTAIFTPDPTPEGRTAAWDTSPRSRPST